MRPSVLKPLIFFDCDFNVLMLWALICYAVDFLVGKSTKGKKKKNKRGPDPYLM